MKYVSTHLILVMIIFNKNVHCRCITSFLTKCESFSDLNKNVTDSENWSELQIGDESSTKHTKESVNLMQFKFQKFTELRSMKIINLIDDLESGVFARCVYRLKLDYLTFYGNNLTTIKKNSVPLIKLKILSLKNNNIARIEAEALQWHRIEVLDFSNNAMEGIESYSLPQNNYTKMLLLSNNKISFIDANSFGTGLEVLDLSKNKLRFVPNEAFHDLKNLKALILSDNKFTALPGLEDLKNVRFFDFSHNEIESIDENQFTKFSKLELLDLSFNKLSEAPFLSQFLKRDRALTVSLEFNYLVNVDFDSDDLRRFYDSNKILLYGNPWQCNNWTSIEGSLQRFLNKCDYGRFKDGKSPFCVNFNQFDLTLGYPDSIAEFQNTFIDSGEFKGCDLRAEKAKLVHEKFTQNCVF